MAEQWDDAAETHVLRNDAGAAVHFTGKLFSESSYFDEEQGTLTRLKLYTTDDNRQVYSVVSSSDTAKWRRVYVLRVEDDLCHIHNGVQEITLRVDMLLTVVYGLCGIDPAQADSLRAFLEHTLKAANA